MLNKQVQLSALVVEQDPDIIVLCETWTNDKVENSEISFNGYNIQDRKDREDSLIGRGGGVIIYTREGSVCHKINISSQFQQICGIRIDGVDIYVVYRSPNSNQENCTKQSNKLLKC